MNQYWLIIDKSPVNVELVLMTHDYWLMIHDLIPMNDDPVLMTYDYWLMDKGSNPFWIG